MPVSSNKRKRQNKKRKYVPKFLLPKKQSENISDREREDGAKTIKSSVTSPTFSQMLYDNDAEGLFRLVAFSPLITGTWLAGGIALSGVSTFAAVASALIFSQYLPSFIKDKDVIFIRDFKLVLYVVLIGLWYLFYFLSSHLLAVVLLAFASILLICSGFLRLDSPRTVIIAQLSLIMQMCLFSLVGIASQSYRITTDIFLEHAILGLVPALILSASLTAKYSRVFLDASWSRGYSVTAKDGSLLLRPSSLSRLFSLLLLFGPIIPVSFAPLGIFPWSFLLCCILYLFIPNIAEGFLKERISDKDVSLKTIHLALLASFLVFLSALLADLL